MQSKTLLLRLSRIKKSFRCQNISYKQGQSFEPHSREYFYFIDHQGMLFMDDAKMKNFTSCFKDKKFLQFFFTRLKINSGKYREEFPYYSPCGREHNYVRCDDVPIVFTQILEPEASGDPYHISYAHAGDLLKVIFEPEKICMLPESGRVYHPGPEATGGIGLIKSSLAIQLSKNFGYDKDNVDESPISFIWKGEKHTLTYEILEKLNKLKEIKLL